jgi:hypothetical protein
MNAHALRWMSLEVHLRRAIERKELQLHYQPQVSLRDGKSERHGSAAALELRGAGRISPVDFIPLAEDSGLILPIGNWVMRGLPAEQGLAADGTAASADGGGQCVGAPVLGRHPARRGAARAALNRAGAAVPGSGTDRNA